MSQKQDIFLRATWFPFLYKLNATLLCARDDRLTCTCMHYTLIRASFVLK